MIWDPKRIASRAQLDAVLGGMIAGLLLLAGLSAESSTNLFTSGVGGYNTYRIPALYETMNGTLLAFCEGRKNSSSDTGDIDTVLRRSLDGGLTWTAQQVVWSDSTNTCGNPTVVQDNSNGRIWLFLTWNNGNDTQTAIGNGTSIDVRKIYSCYSDDNGATWSAPANRFAEVQPSNTRWDATGPGRGIQMVNGQPGRLIIPANGRNIQSDNHGTTWTQSTWLPSGTSESSVVEISGGGLLRNDRAVANKQLNARVFCNSANQGASWGPLAFRTDLVDSICQGSTIAVNNSGGLNGRMLVFSNPADTNRDTMTIQCSLDDGVTWPFSQLVYAGSSAYSCLTGISTTYIGLLYERDSYGKITFDKFTYASLVPIAPTNQPARTWEGSAGAGNEMWQQASNWDSNTVPIFDSGLDVVFNAAGAANLTNCLGGNRNIRSLNFNAAADSNVGIYLAEKITSPATNYVLTFDGFLGRATNTVQAGATGNFTIGAGGLGSITLASDLVISHNGSGSLIFARPINESVAGKNLAKDGTGTVILASSNTFSGTVTVNAGKLLVGANTSSGTGPLVLNDGVTFASDTNAARSLANNVTLGGNVTLGQLAGGTGNLIFNSTFNLGAATRTLTINNATAISGVVSNGGLSKTGSGMLALSGANTYTGQTTIYAGMMQLGDGGGSGSLDPTGIIAIGPNGSFQYNRSNNLNPFANNLAGTGTLVKTNIGELGLTGTNSFSGTIDIQQGKLGLSGSACLNGAPNVNVGANGILSVGTGFLGGTATIGKLSGSGLIDPVYGQGTAVRSLQVNQAADGVFSGILADGSSGRILAFIKAGAAMLTLSGTNTYSGGTTVSNGALLVNGAISNSAVSVKSGATLGGIGVVAGVVSVESGGTLSPGISIGTLAMNSSLTLAGTTFVEVNATNGQCDRIQGLTNLAYGGNLVVSNLAGGDNPPTLGQTFQLFTVPATRSGNFSTITPALTAGKLWSFNPTSGVLNVVSGTATYPTNITSSLMGGNLSLTWPASHLGWVVQSNIRGLANPGNWFDIPGSSSVTNLNIVPTLTWTNVFYRLRAP